MRNNQDNIVTNVRLFISSTFMDMQKERNYLFNYVVPKMKLLCEERGLNFFCVDLRWGITTEAQEKGTTTSICLGAIDDSRPFFVGMLGERYGWIPEKLSEEDYVAFPFLKDNEGLSITELEMNYGVLNNGIEKGFAAFYLRDQSLSEEYVEYVTKEEEESLGRDNAEKICEVRSQKLAALKDRIKKSPYPFLDGYTTIEQFGEKVYEDFHTWIEREIPCGTNVEKGKQEAYIKMLLDIKAGNVRFEHFLDNYIEEHQNVPLLIITKDDVLKRILVSWTDHKKSEQNQFIIVNCFASDKMQNHSNIAAYILQELEALYPDQLSVFRDNALNGLYGQLYDDTVESCLIKACERLEISKKLTIIITDLHMLVSGAGRILDWLPHFMSNNISLLCTTDDKSMFDLISYLHWNSVDAEFGDNAEQNIFFARARLLNYHKSLDKAIQDILMNHPVSHNMEEIMLLVDYLIANSIHDTLTEDIDSILKIAQRRPIAVAIEELRISTKSLKLQDLYFAFGAIMYELDFSAKEDDVYQLLNEILNINYAQWTELLLIARPFFERVSGSIVISNNLVKQHYSQFPITFIADEKQTYMEFADFYSRKIEAATKESIYSLQKNDYHTYVKSVIKFLIKADLNEQLREFVKNPRVLYQLSLHDWHTMRSIWLHLSNVGLLDIKMMYGWMFNQQVDIFADLPKEHSANKVLTSIAQSWQYFGDNINFLHELGIYIPGDYVYGLYVDASKEFINKFLEFKDRYSKIDSQATLDAWFRDCSIFIEVANSVTEKMYVYELISEYAMRYASADYFLKVAGLFLHEAVGLRDKLHICRALYMYGLAFSKKSIVNPDCKINAKKALELAFSLSKTVGNYEVYEKILASAK